MPILSPNQESAFIAAATLVLNELSIEHFEDGESLDLENNLQKAIVATSHFHTLYKNLVREQTIPLYVQNNHALCLSNVIAIFEACITKITGVDEYHLDETVLLTMLRIKLQEHPEIKAEVEAKHDTNAKNADDDDGPDLQSYTY